MADTPEEINKRMAERTHTLMRQIIEIIDKRLTSSVGVENGVFEELVATVVVSTALSRIIGEIVRGQSGDQLDERLEELVQEVSNLLVNENGQPSLGALLN